jgi:hypothetical protein
MDLTHVPKVNHITYGFYGHFGSGRYSGFLKFLFLPVYLRTAMVWLVRLNAGSQLAAESHSNLWPNSLMGV